MELKTIEIDGKTYAEVQGGKPVYLDEGKEVAFDADYHVQTITRLNGESMDRRNKLRDAEEALAKFEGIEDPKAAIEALETVKNLDAKQLIDAGEVDKVKAEITKVFEEKLEAAEAEISKRDKIIDDKVIGDSFVNSKFLKEEVAAPGSLIRSEFSKNFTVEDGKLVAKDANGNQIYSKEKPGELAGFDEAMSVLVEAHPDRDYILADKTKGGGGSPKGGGGGGKQTKKFAEMSGAELSALRKENAQEYERLKNEHYGS